MKPKVHQVPDGGEPSLVLDGVSMNYKVHSVNEGIAQRMPWHKKLVYGLIRRRPRVTVRALKEISLVVPKGQSLGIVGRNGSGKSTISQIISGKLTPSTGAVWANGTPTMLGVNAALIPALSGRENIVLGGLALGMSRKEIEARIPEIVESVGLQKAIDLPIDTYSSGMGARLRFAIATIRDPEVLVIDEALNTGDAQFRERSRRRMEELKANAGCVILVSHSEKVIAASCDRVLWLHDGEQVADGPTDDVLYQYRRYNWLLSKQRVGEAERWRRQVQAQHTPTSVRFGS
ncbi:MAG: ATP-binding cassette domain-containing protein [Actinomycetia bacterium]|nr:ATP-binding cassette domain-containing protein [Actinomycetes bacterium]